MFAWGSTIHGELGLGGIEEEHILTPRILDWYLANTVIEAALGENHTLLLTKDGKVYSCGNNDYGQLGHDQPRKRPQQVSNLEAHPIIHVSCGATHSMALNQWGQVFTWGSDLHGQLGQQISENLAAPKIVKSLAQYHVVQIACGQRHSVCLTNSGLILTWGANNFGQLGVGTDTTSESLPILVHSLTGIPMAFITTGANHTFVLSKSGAVFGWGKNTRGQLGLNDSDNKKYPQQLRTLRNIRVKFISCGEEFSIFLTQDGGVLTCGAGMYGQLGHGSLSNEILPRQVVELMGSTITQVTCGRQHSLALVPSRGRVYSFGIGGSGQLGLRKSQNAITPQVVQGPWVSPSGNPIVQNDKKAHNVIIHRIFAGGDHCFALVTERKSKIPPYDNRKYEPDSQILTLKIELVQEMLQIPPDTPVDQEILSYIETVFKSLSCFNASSLLEDDKHYYCTSKHHGVKMEDALAIFETIGKVENKTITNLIFTCIKEDILKQLKPSPPDVEVLRIYLTLPLYHEFVNIKHHNDLQTPFALHLLNLSKQALRVVGGWYGMMNCDYFERLVNIYKSIAIFILRNQNISQGKTCSYDPSLVAALDVLAFLNKINHSIEGLKVPYDTFHLSDLTDLLDIRVDYVLWLSDPGTSKLFLCSYPFVFDAQAKTLLLETDQTIQMQSAMQNAAIQAFLTFATTPDSLTSINQFLFLNVSRDHIVQDALRELGQVNQSDLKKPLKVKFHDEEAVDAGGVTKEFFLLLLKEILDPKYGMFEEYPETRSIWFSCMSFEDDAMYFLIGMICGLAIYNFTIINVPFPLALYKKLLNEPVGLVDLKGLSPEIANSLTQVLEYKEPDLQEVFDLTFQISKNVWGETKDIPLKPDGANIPVTQNNKVEFVDLYVNYLLNESVEQQFKAFHSGFMKVCGGRVLQLFHSHELMNVMIGNENYDWHALEEAASYKNGYSSSDETIRWFWEVIHEMSLDDKKKFLLFLTGSDRIPLQGMKAIKIEIQPTFDEKFLPVAHTCFNLLDLPKYKTKERLKYKLMQAIQQTQGFSLV